VTDPGPRLALVIVGHVDHGKSTLLGRLLADTGRLPDGALDKVRRICDEQAKPLEYAFLLDALEEEQLQGVTIDVTRVRFAWRDRQYLFIDAPGHREFIRNMISGAAHAEAAVLLIDAKEGIQEQSRRHAYLASFLGIRSVVVVVNKMDLVDYAEHAFRRIADDYRTFLRSVGLSPVAVLPASAREGENLVSPSPRMAWYEGGCLLDILARVPAAAPAGTGPLRLPVQAILKFDDRRIVVGRIESGRLAPGQEIQVWPSGQRTRIRSVEAWPESGDPPAGAAAGESVGITLDDQLFVQRGDVLADPVAAPRLSAMVRANVLWIGRRRLEPGQRYRVRLTTLEREVSVLSITRGMSSATMEAYETGDHIAPHDVGEVLLRAARPLVFDTAAELPSTGRLVLLDGYDIVGGGIVLDDDELYRRPYGPEWPRSEHIGPAPLTVTADERAGAYGHRAHVVWLTGMPGAGKSSVARLVERRLFAHGVKTFVLDGEQLRFGLSADLRFTDADRSEQARRAAEVARLFQRAGVVVIVALVSPFAADREYARALAGADGFTLIHLHAPLAVLRGRERHGLYATAERDPSVRIPGVNAPYEVPEQPTLRFDTGSVDIGRVSDAIVDHVLGRIL
jgi:bifunctional enzyme CysN/CysC